jgi:hypothetical protein
MTTDIHVKTTDIIGTSIRVFSAWEESAPMGAHSSLCLSTYEDKTGVWFGRVGTNRDLPAEVEALPAGSDERIAAVRQWYESHYERAYAAIIAAHPEAATGKRDSGEIELVVKA